jgi:uncharacterized phage protein (TIGR01671 family)
MAMREIEFRGKRIEGIKNWVYGNGFVIDNATVGLPVYVWENVPYSQFFKVAPETVGQYTGLTDKKGVKIFEGDIVRILPEEYAAKVIFRLGGWMLWLGPDGDDEYLYDFASPGNIEVIGNIHDNPELLEARE